MSFAWLFVQLFGSLVSWISVFRFQCLFSICPLVELAVFGVFKNSAILRAGSVSVFCISYSQCRFCYWGGSGLYGYLFLVSLSQFYSVVLVFDFLSFYVVAGKEFVSRNFSSVC